MVKLHVGLLEPLRKVLQVTVAAEGVALQVELLRLRVVGPEDLFEGSQRRVGEPPDLVVLEVQVAEVAETLDVELDALELVVAQVELLERDERAEHVQVVDAPDLVLLQVQLLDLGQVGGGEDVLEVAEVPLRVDGLGEGVGEVELLEVEEVGEDARVVLRPADDEVVVVEDEPLHVAHLVEGLAGDLSYAVVGEVDYLFSEQRGEIFIFCIGDIGVVSASKERNRDCNLIE